MSQHKALGYGSSGFRWAYDGLWLLLLALLRVLARFLPKLSAQLQERVWQGEPLEAWRKQRASAERSFLFFCSSAGEYEQAKPLLSRLQEQGRTFLLIVFVSPSGTRFAKTQKETIPYLLAPHDRPRFWQQLFEALRPDAFILVRYELWPGFLLTARTWGPIYLVDGVRSPKLASETFALWLRRKLLGSIERIFVVGADDHDFYLRTLHVSEDRLRITGDTKYDRVLERVKERQVQWESLSRSLAGFVAGQRVIVLGSAWPADVEAFMRIYPQIKALHPQTKVILAPHDLSADNLELIRSQLTAVRSCQVSIEGFAGAHADHDVLLVDMIGVLPELYGLGHLAWVGGAMHFRVHNVLEPACRGLYVCFGPHHETSQEARAMVAQALVQVIHSGEEFLDWYKTLDWNATPPNERLWQMVKQQRGASDRILAGILNP